MKLLKYTLCFYLGGCVATSWSVLLGPYGALTPFTWPYMIADLWYYVLFGPIF